MCDDKKSDPSATSPASPVGRHRSMDGGSAGLGRFFAHGDLRLVILYLMAEKPRHGYEMIKWIEEAVAGIYSPSPGTIYPALTMLEEAGQAVALPTGDGPRKLYRITDLGHAFLEANRPALQTLLKRMHDAADAHGEAHIPPQLERAVESLRLAIRHRLATGPADQERLDDIAVGIDETAERIRRS